MNFMQKSTAGTSRDRAHQIVTGKRTEHQRPCSPFGMAEPETTSSSYNGGGEGNRTGPGCILSYYTTGSSQTLSSDEEEDMANCLIMLAQSVSPAKEDKSDLHCQNTEKSKNRKLTEIAATTAGGKSEFHNYECKTCNRAFLSFQALGGHRASHKKPKLTIEDQKSVSVQMEFSAEDQPEVVVEYEENKTTTNNTKIPPPSGFTQTGHKNIKGKVHECSICGSEFFSGQALGGHMRRHRPPPPSNNQITVSSNVDDTRVKKSSVLSLDLNLPAPEMVDDVHSKFQYTASSANQPLVFPPAALVDCHY